MIRVKEKNKAVMVERNNKYQCSGDLHGFWSPDCLGSNLDRATLLL